MAAYDGQSRDLSVNVILPNAGRNPHAFYEPKTGALRPQFELRYRTDLRVLYNVSVNAVKSANPVIAILALDTT